jgi:hypothetical protein
MNEWDLKRLYPGASVSTEEQELRPTYEEDVVLEEQSPDDEEREVKPDVGYEALIRALEEQP